MRVYRSMALTVLCAAAVAMSGCSSLGGGSSSGAKWLDFGNGVLNLNQTSRIIPERTILGGISIKFDEFTLTLTVPDDTRKGFEGKSGEQITAEIDSILNANMKQVRDFLGSNSSYMQLK